MYIDVDKRVQWIDILRGLATILIVIGHSGIEIISKYIYWFHMPLFFVISGFLFKSLNNTAEIGSYIKKRTYRLLKPYFSYLIVIFMLFETPNLIVHHENLLHIFTSFLFVSFIGGRAVGGLFGVYWFFTCLLITQILFAVINTKIKSIKSQILIVFVLFFFAHIEANYIKSDFMSTPIPWNADVAIFALLFYAFGFYLKDLFDLKNSEQKKMFFISINMNTLYKISIILSIIFIDLNINGIIDYSLDLKNVAYNNLLLDLIIPTTLILSTIFAVQLNFPNSLKIALTSIGTNSLPIIFLHNPIRYLFDIVNNTYIHTSAGSSVIYIILGLTVPFYLNTLILRKIHFKLFTD